MDKKLADDELRQLDDAYPAPDADNDFEDQYRSISKTAILSMVFAIFALIAVPFMFLIPEVAIFVGFLASIGIGFGLLAVWGLKRYPDEIVGWGPAKIGLIGSLVFAVGGFGLYGYVYATEVPPDHQRISFSMLKPDKRKEELVPQAAFDLDGKKVFIKGFVRPGQRRVGLKQFILVGDFGDCCFGGNPEITDVIAVDLLGDLKVDYSYRLRRIAGTFKLNPGRRLVDEDGIPQVFYTIEADYIR